MVHLIPVAIKLDDQHITEYNVQQYRAQIALVSQEPTLYVGTIRFNILMGAVKPDSEVTQEEIEEVCRDANILEFIKSLPECVFPPVLPFRYYLMTLFSVALKRKLVVKALNFLVARNVCLFARHYEYLLTVSRF